MRPARGGGGGDIYICVVVHVGEFGISITENFGGIVHRSVESVLKGGGGGGLGHSWGCECWGLQPGRE